MLWKGFVCPAPLAVSLTLVPLVFGTYQWPSPQYEALEELLYEGTDKAFATPASVASGCVSRRRDGGPPIGAEWLRLAYNDMSTHNVTDGTGGLDASIYYEYTRTENIGKGIISSLKDFALSANKYVSHADVIAMGAVWGVASCSGPVIPFRGGRVDALAAGRHGVPQPDQDLKDHTEKFRLQGFTPTEMISLVACGHAIGAVRNADFPNIVPDPDPAGQGNKTVVQAFDSTTKFDSTIVTEYLNGTTKNPLVTVSNATLQSDLRIFSSDKNVTMKSIATDDNFFKTCSLLLERMINTVPSNVNLTEEIKFLPFKIKRARLAMSDDSKLVMHVTARIQVPNNGSVLGATLLWCDGRGPAKDCADGNVHFANGVIGRSMWSLSEARGPLSTALNLKSIGIEFNAPLGDASINKFWVEYQYGNGTVVVEDNAGAGYVVTQDTLIALPPMQQEFGRAFDPDLLRSVGEYLVIAGVKNVTTPTSVMVHTIDMGLETTILDQPNRVSLAPTLNRTYALLHNTTMPEIGGYRFYTALVTGDFTTSFDVTAEVDGTRHTIDFLTSIDMRGVSQTVSRTGKRALDASPGSAPGEIIASPGTSVRFMSRKGWLFVWTVVVMLGLMAL